MTIDTSLLNLDRVPTLKEMRDFFKKHDWSSAKISNPNNLSSDDNKAIKYIIEILNTAFEKEAHARGIDVWTEFLNNTIRTDGEKYQNNPLIALRDNVENIVAEEVNILLTGPDEIVDSILRKFDLIGPEADKKADVFLKNAVGTMLDVMEFDKVAKVIRDNPAFEDFNPSLRPNFRAIDHYRKWYHTEAEIEVDNYPEPESDYSRDYSVSDPEKIVIFNILVEDYWNNLDAVEKKIHRLLEQGFTQKEIAKILGYSGNSAISKRLKNMRLKFRKSTGV